MENCNNIKDILNLIVTLQKKDNKNCDSQGCGKPFLGPNSNDIYNTRPLRIISCGNDCPWSMPYTLNNECGTSTIFKIENVDCNCATFRILVELPDDNKCNYLLTNSYFTMNIDCILALQCLNDTCTL